jgi:hypothetical protein
MHSAGAVTCVHPAIGVASVTAGAVTGVVAATVSGTVVVGSAVVVGAAVSTVDDAAEAGAGAEFAEGDDDSSEHAATTPSKTTAIAATRFTYR